MNQHNTFCNTATSIKVDFDNSQMVNVQYAWAYKNEGNGIVLNRSTH